MNQRLLPLQAGLDIHQITLQSPLGCLQLSANAQGLIDVSWTDEKENGDAESSYNIARIKHREKKLRNDALSPISPTGDLSFEEQTHLALSWLDITRAQLQAYFCGQQVVFEMPLVVQGTPFQQAVWQALLDIPYGVTQSYQDIAILIGRPSAVRAVGQANRVNRLPVVIPCHRVIGKNGSMVGYAGKDINRKMTLLEIEKAQS